MTITRVKKVQNVRGDTPAARQKSLDVVDGRFQPTRWLMMTTTSGRMSTAGRHCPKARSRTWAVQRPPQKARDSQPMRFTGYLTPPCGTPPRRACSSPTPARTGWSSLAACRRCSKPRVFRSTAISAISRAVRIGGGKSRRRSRASSMSCWCSRRPRCAHPTSRENGSSRARKARRSRRSPARANSTSLICRAGWRGPIATTSTFRRAATG